MDAFGTEPAVGSVTVHAPAVAPADLEDVAIPATAVTGAAAHPTGPLRKVPCRHLRLPIDAIPTGIGSVGGKLNPAMLQIGSWRFGRVNHRLGESRHPTLVSRAIDPLCHWSQVGPRRLGGASSRRFGRICRPRAPTPPRWRGRSPAPQFPARGPTFPFPPQSTVVWQGEPHAAPLSSPVGNVPGPLRSRRATHVVGQSGPIATPSCRDAEGRRKVGKRNESKVHDGAGYVRPVPVTGQVLHHPPQHPRGTIPSITGRRKAPSLEATATGGPAASVQSPRGGRADEPTPCTVSWLDAVAHPTGFFPVLYVEHRLLPIIGLSALDEEAVDGGRSPFKVPAEEAAQCGWWDTSDRGADRQSPPIRAARTEELADLRTIEFAADRIFDSVGIGPFANDDAEDHFEKAVLVLVTGEPPVGFVMRRTGRRSHHTSGSCPCIPITLDKVSVDR